jgi:hypothetical protein
VGERGDFLAVASIPYAHSHIHVDNFKAALALFLSQHLPVKNIFLLDLPKTRLSPQIIPKAEGILLAALFNAEQELNPGFDPSNVLSFFDGRVTAFDLAKSHSAVVRVNPIVRSLTLGFIQDKISPAGAVAAMYSLAVELLRKQIPVDEYEGYIILAGPLLNEEMLNSVKAQLVMQLPDSISLIGVKLPTSDHCYYGGSLLARKDGSFPPSLDALYGQQGLSPHLKKGEQWLKLIEKSSQFF